MKKHLIKMPSISQFINATKDIVHQAKCVGLDDSGNAVYDASAKLPTIKFRGTVKLHGTNASVCYNPETEELWAQSKGNVLTIEKDNAGFASFVKKNEEYFIKQMKDIVQANPKIEEVCVYGEWAGKGIQKGVAISELEKTFYAFGIKFKLTDEEDYRWARDASFTLSFWTSEERKIRSIYEFETFEIQIDFNNPKLSQNEMIKLTERVEEECPVAKSFGVSGTGEGIVWEAYYKDTKHTFKVKGDKHANSKVKKLKPVDDVKEQAKIDFANYACPAWRLEQMHQETFNTQNGGRADIKGTGAFLKAVVADVMKEELEKMFEAGLEPRDVNKMISKVARTWFMTQLEKDILG